MRNVRALAVFLLFAAVFAAFSPGAACSEPVVVIVTVDGTRWDAVEGVRGFEEIGQRGTRALRMRSVFPSQTCPSHASIATGAGPAVHGVVSNDFFDRSSGEEFDHSLEARWLEVEPIWATAEKAGLKTAVSEWPVSEGPWKGSLPTYYRAYSDDNDDEGTVDWVLSLLRMKEGRPRLVMAWLRACDVTGHVKGPESPEYRAAAVRTGELLEKLAGGVSGSGMAGEVVLMVVSDHGMSAVSGEIEIALVVKKVDPAARVVVSSTIAMVYASGPGKRKDILRALRRVPGGAVFEESDRAGKKLSLGSSPRVGDIIAVAPRGLMFAPLVRKYKNPTVGAHGYPPSEPDMCGVFFAAGPGVPRKVVREAEVTDIAPTALKLLGLERPPHMEGSPIF